jgi:hypothetical protein
MKSGLYCNITISKTYRDIFQYRFYMTVIYKISNRSIDFENLYVLAIEVYSMFNNVKTLGVQNIDQPKVFEIFT